MTSGLLTLAIFQEANRWRLPDAHVEAIRAAAGDVEVRTVGTRAELLQLMPETTQLVGFPLTYDQFDQLGKSVQWVQMTGPLGDAISSLLPAVKRGVRVSTAASIRGPQIAEHAVALTLALLRHIDDAVLAQTEHRWAAAEIAPVMRSLHGSTVGIVAFGTMRDEIAQRVKALGVQVLATSTSPDEDHIHIDEMLELPQLEDLLVRSDVVIVASPRHPGSKPLIGRRELARMGNDTFLIDVSRGGVVDQVALLEALRRQRIAGAGIDAFETQPLPSASPLWTMPNVIITPSVAAASAHYWEHATEVICRNIKRFAKGRPLIDELTTDWFDAVRG
ncbi:MAG: NAD(P)-dependent oxidoreductase [Phycisphaerales bacterium JB050]